MKSFTKTGIAAGFAAVALLSGTAASAQVAPSAEAAAFLASATGLGAAITTVEAATGGKVATIEFVLGEDGNPDLIMADVIMADGSEKEVSVNPADGTVLKIADDEADDEADDDEDEDDEDDEDEDEDEDEDGED